MSARVWVGAAVLLAVLWATSLATALSRAPAASAAALAHRQAEVQRFTASQWPWTGR